MRKVTVEVLRSISKSHFINLQMLCIVNVVQIDEKSPRHRNSDSHQNVRNVYDPQIMVVIK